MSSFFILGLPNRTSVYKNAGPKYWAVPKSWNPQIGLAPYLVLGDLYPPVRRATVPFRTLLIAFPPEDDICYCIVQKENFIVLILHKRSVPTLDDKVK